MSGASGQALYRSCMKEAAAQGRSLMDRMVARAGPLMMERAVQSNDVIDRNMLPEAAQVLAKHHGALAEAYPQALLAEFAQAIAGDTRKAAALSFDSLELMGDDQVRESVEVVRTQQQVTNMVEAELSELNALICAVQGLPSVQAERNPLRPEVYVRALRTVTQQSPVSHSVRIRWMQYLGEALGPELAVNYRQLSRMLRDNGVSGVGYNITPSPEAPAAAAPAGTGKAEADPQLLNVRELRRLLTGEFDPPGVESARDLGQPSDFSMTVPAAYEALREMKQVNQAIQRIAQRQAAGVLDGGEGTAALRQALRGEARRPGQALGLEVVNLMVENIAGDPRLLPPVQQAVRDLEPALLRLALADPRFFSDKRHPARRLLDQLTQRSLAWTRVDQEGFAAFMDPLQQAVDALVETQTTGAEPFDFALRTLEETWGEQQKRDRRYREKAVRALLQAEQRNLLADRIGRELRARGDLLGAPPEVQRFVVGPWSQVLAQARLGDPDGAADPHGYAGIVSDLVWSSQPHVAAANTARLMRLVRPLVEKLREGLASIDFPQAAAQRFLDVLAELHQQALRARPGEAARPVPLSTTLTREQLEAQFGGGDDAWLAPREARHSGFMQTDLQPAQQPLFQATQPGFGETAAHIDPGIDEAALPQSELAPGAWVELFHDGGWARFQLSWASPHGTLFMFTGTGGKTHSMTRRLMDKMLAAGTMRMVSSQAVVDNALDAVAQAALRNSLDVKL
jgi:hypothetical protein